MIAISSELKVGGSKVQKSVFSLLLFVFSKDLFIPRKPQILIYVPIYAKNILEEYPINYKKVVI